MLDLILFAGALSLGATALVGAGALVRYGWELPAKLRARNVHTAEELPPVQHQVWPGDGVLTDAETGEEVDFGVPARADWRELRPVCDAALDAYNERVQAAIDSDDQGNRWVRPGVGPDEIRELWVLHGRLTQMLDWVWRG